MSKQPDNPTPTDDEPWPAAQMTITAHQRLIRDEMMALVPRTQATSLRGYSVETISREDAAPIILHYEWLRSIGRATVFIGLVSPSREIEGVACFGHGPAGNIRQLIGEPALCLERGACVHFAPPNAASFLINAACKLVYRMTGVELFFAYGDPMAGEYGAVYQAAGWLYLGQGLDGKRGRARRFMVLPPGRDPNDPSSWKTTRELRRVNRRMSFDEARANGWQIASREAKHVYATNVGRYRKQWKRKFSCPPYPSPRPGLKLKRKPEDESGEPARVKRLDPLRFSVKAHPPKQLSLSLAPMGLETPPDLPASR